jgi:SAM-dependent methyltransferase
MPNLRNSNTHSAHGFSLGADSDYIRLLVAKGGPCEEDDEKLNAWMARAHTFALAGQLSEQDRAKLLGIYGAAMSTLTIQGFALQKPHGYAGDFELIDRIYQQYVSSEPTLANWDHFFQRQAGAKAVRNRKAYFHDLLNHHDAAGSPRVLKIGVGPGRSMFEWLSANKSSKATFDCVEIDPKAVQYATTLNQPFLERIQFIRKNCLKWQPTQQYNLIWAAGIFDYFDDATFLQMTQRLLAAVAADGELVIGNFANTHPCRPYMEFVGKWFLHHRSANQLVDLAMQCGVERERIAIGCEELGVNLFLHIRP